MVKSFNWSYILLDDMDSDPVAVQDNLHIRSEAGDMSLNPATGKFEDLVFDTKTGKLMAVKNKAPVNPDNKIFVEMDGFFTKEA